VVDFVFRLTLSPAHHHHLTPATSRTSLASTLGDDPALIHHQEASHPCNSFIQAQILKLLDCSVLFPDATLLPYSKWIPATLTPTPLLIAAPNPRSRSPLAPPLVRSPSPPCPPSKSHSSFSSRQTLHPLTPPLEWISGDSRTGWIRWC
jgi:hypothetical protein